MNIVFIHMNIKYENMYMSIGIHIRISRIL